MNEPREKPAQALSRQDFTLPSFFLVALGASFALASVGCTIGEKFTQAHDQMTKAWEESPINLWKPPPAPPGAVETLVLHGDGLEPEKVPADSKGFAELAGARDLFRRGDYATAEKLFRHVADNTKNAPQIAEEARFYEAECLRLQQDYPKAADVYTQMLNDFHFGTHRDAAVEREFELANYWLDDTREEIRQDKEQKDGKRWFVWHGPAVHFEKTKPLLDQEGRALEKLEQVALNDLTGPRADEALFLIGSVKFYREDYKDADRYFSQVVDYHPQSKYAPQAMEYAIISKHLSTGGPDYDGRKVAEARKYVDTALRNYGTPPEKTEFLERQLAGINKQQAEHDFHMAEFYERTGHPGAAFFYYEIVRRRYPGTPYYDQATEKMKQLKPRVDQANQRAVENAAQPEKPLGLAPARHSPNASPADMLPSGSVPTTPGVPGR